MPMAEFGEKVHGMIQSKKWTRPGKPKWDEGIFSGLVQQSHEYIIGAPQGIKKCGSIKRMAPSVRWDLAALNAIRGTPWQWKPDEGEIDVEMPKAPHIEVEPRQKARQSHQAEQRSDATFTGRMWSTMEEHAEMARCALDVQRP